MALEGYSKEQLYEALKMALAYNDFESAAMLRDAYNSYQEPGMDLGEVSAMRGIAGASNTALARGAAAAAETAQDTYYGGPVGSIIAGARGSGGFGLGYRAGKEAEREFEESGIERPAEGEAPLDKFIAEARDIGTIESEYWKQGRPKGAAAGFVYDAGSAVAQMLPSIGAGMITRSPNLALTMMGFPAYGMAYEERLAEGGTKEEAVRDGLVSLLAELGPEKLFGVWGKALNAKTMKELIKTMGLEAGSEWTTEQVNMLYEGLLGESQIEGFGDWFKRGAYAAGLGAFIGGGMTLPNIPGNRRAAAYEEAQAAYETNVDEYTRALLDPSQAQYERVSAAEAQRRAAEAGTSTEFDFEGTTTAPLQAPEMPAGDAWNPSVVGTYFDEDEWNARDDTYPAQFDEPVVAEALPEPVPQATEWPAETAFPEVNYFQDTREWRSADSVALDLTEEQQVEWDLFNQRMDEIRAQEADMWSKLSFAKQTSGDPSDMSLEELREWEAYSRTIEDTGVGINEQSSLEEKINRDIELEGLKSEDTKRWAYAANSDNVRELGNYVVTDFDPTTRRVWADYRTDNGVVHYTWIIGETLPRLYRTLPEDFVGEPTPQDYKARHAYGGAKFDAKRLGLKSEMAGFSKEVHKRINRALDAAARYGTPEIVMKDVAKAERNKLRMFTGAPNPEMQRQQLIQEAKRAYQYEARTNRELTSPEKEAEFVERYLLQQGQRKEQTREAVLESLGLDETSQQWAAMPKLAVDGNAEVETWISEQDRLDIQYGRAMEARAYQILPNGDVRVLRVRPTDNLDGYNISIVEQNGQRLYRPPRVATVKRRLTKAVTEPLSAIKKPTTDEKFGVIKARKDAQAQREAQAESLRETAKQSELSKELKALRNKAAERAREYNKKQKPQEEKATRAKPSETELYSGPAEGAEGVPPAQPAPATMPKGARSYRTVTIDGVEHHAEKVKYDPNEPPAWVVWPVGMPRSTAQPVAKNLEQLMQVVESGTTLGVPLVNDALRAELAKRGDFDTEIKTTTDLGAKRPKQETVRQLNVERPKGVETVTSERAVPRKPAKPAKDRGEQLVTRTETAPKLTKAEEQLANTYQRQFVKDGIEYQAAKEGGDWLVWRRGEKGAYVVAGKTVADLENFVAAEGFAKKVKDRISGKGDWAGQDRALYQETRDINLYDSTTKIDVPAGFFKERVPTYRLGEAYDRTLREQRVAEREEALKKSTVIVDGELVDSKEFILRSRTEHKAAKDKFLQRLLDKIETIVENNSNNAYYTMLESIVDSAPAWLQQMVPAARTEAEAVEAFKGMLDAGTYTTEIAKALKSELRSTMKKQGLAVNTKLTDELVDAWINDRSSRKAEAPETSTLQRGGAIVLTPKGRSQLAFAKKFLKSLMSGRAIKGRTVEETEMLSAYVDLPSEQIIRIAQGLADYIALYNPEVPTANQEATFEEIVRAYLTTETNQAVRELQARRNRARADADARGEMEVAAVERAVVLQSLLPTLSSVLSETAVAPQGIYYNTIMPEWDQRIADIEASLATEWRSEAAVAQEQLESRPAGPYKAPEKAWTANDIKKARTALKEWADEEWSKGAALREEIAKLQEQIRLDNSEGGGKLSPDSISKLIRLERARTLQRIARTPRKPSSVTIAAQQEEARIREARLAEERAAEEARLQRLWEAEDAEEVALRSRVQQELDARETLRRQAADEATFKASIEAEQRRIAELRANKKETAPEYEQDGTGRWVKVREAELAIGQTSEWGMAIPNDMITEIPVELTTATNQPADRADMPATAERGLGDLLLDPVAKDMMVKDIWREASTLSGQEQWRNSYKELGQNVLVTGRIGRVPAKTLTEEEIIESAHRVDLEDPNPVKQGIFSVFTASHGGFSPLAWMPPKLLKYIAQSKYAGLYDPLEILTTQDALRKKQLKSRREAFHAYRRIKGEVQRAVNMSRVHWALARRELKKAGWKRLDKNWENAINSYLEGVSAENVAAEYGVTIPVAARTHLNKWTSYANLIALYGADNGAWSRDSTRGAVIGGRAYLSHTAAQTKRTQRQLIERHIPRLRELAKRAWSLPSTPEEVDALGRNALINLLNDTTHGLWSQYLGRSANDTDTEAGSTIVFSHNGVTVDFGKGENGKISKKLMNAEVAAHKDPAKQDEIRDRQLADLRKAVKAALPTEDAYAAAIENIANAAIDIERTRSGRGFGASTAIQQQRRLMKSHAELIDDAMSLIKVGKSRERRLQIEAYFRDNRDSLREMTVAQFMTKVTKDLALNRKEMTRAAAHLELNSKLREAINEVTDTESLMARTVESIAKSVFTSDYLASILQTGLANGWASYKQRKGSDWKPLAEAGTALGDSTVYFPGTTRFVKGHEIFVDPNVAEFVQDQAGIEADRRSSWFMETAMKTSGWVKYMKVVLSPLAHPRNFVSTRLIHWKNNAFGFGAYRAKTIGAKMSTGQLLSALSEKTEEFVESKKSIEVQMLEEWMTKRGMLFDGGRAGAMYDLRNEGLGAVSPNTYSVGNREVVPSKVWHWGKRKLKRGKYVADELFRLEDESVKATGFLMEAAAYLEMTGTGQKLLDKALSGAKLTETEQKLLDKALDWSAEVVLNTYPTFSNTSRLVKAISRNPIFGAFPSFSYEVARTSANTLVYIASLAKGAATGKMLDGTVLTGKGQAKAAFLASVKLAGWGAMWSAGSAAAQFLASAVKDMLDTEDEEANGMLTNNWLTRINQSDYQRETRYLKPWYAEDTLSTISEIDPETGNYTMMALDYVMPTGAWEVGIMQGLKRMKDAMASGDSNVISAAAQGVAISMSNMFLNQEVLWGTFLDRSGRPEGQLAYKDDRITEKAGDWAQDFLTVGKRGDALNEITGLVGAGVGAVVEERFAPELIAQVQEGYKWLQNLASAEGSDRDAVRMDMLASGALHVAGLKQKEMTFAEDWARNTKGRLTNLSLSDTTMRHQLALSTADNYDQFKAEFDEFNYYRREAFDSVYWSLQAAQRRLGRSPGEIRQVLDDVQANKSAAGFDLGGINSGKYYAPSRKRMFETLKAYVKEKQDFEGAPDLERAKQLLDWYVQAAREEGYDVTKYE